MAFSFVETSHPLAPPDATVTASARRWRQFTDLPWIVFLVWTGVGFLVMPLDLSETRLHAWLVPGHPGLAAAVGALLRVSDAVWMSLAALNVYFALVTAEGLRIARRWAVAILVGSAVFEWIGATTGVPFGSYVYTDRFGLRLGGVLPFTIPLAWLVILLGARAAILRWRPVVTRAELALGVALVAVLTDVNLEFIAWKTRGYWLWYPDWPATHPGQPAPAWPPWQNFASWFVLMFLLTWILPANTDLRPVRPAWAARRPLLILGLMNTLFLLTHLVRWLRSAALP